MSNKLMILLPFVLCSFLFIGCKKETEEATSLTSSDPEYLTGENIPRDFNILAKDFRLKSYTEAYSPTEKILYEFSYDGNMLSSINAYDIYFDEVIHFLRMEFQNFSENSYGRYYELSDTGWTQTASIGFKWDGLRLVERCDTQVVNGVHLAYESGKYEVEYEEGRLSKVFQYYPAYQEKGTPLFSCDYDSEGRLKEHITTFYGDEGLTVPSYLAYGEGFIYKEVRGDSTLGESVFFDKIIGWSNWDGTLEEWIEANIGFDEYNNLVNVNYPGFNEAIYEWEEGKGNELQIFTNSVALPYCAPVFGPVIYPMFPGGIW